MSQLLAPSPLPATEQLCCYVNFSNQVQIARITGLSEYFERAVFPGQRILFKAPKDAYLELHTGAMATAILSDKISCEQLEVRELDRF